jgi:uncharacterized protein (TIGR02246 family)
MLTSSLALSFALVALQPSPPTPPPDLTATLAALDAALFAATYGCDLEKVASLFAEDVEFFHDLGGVTLGRTKIIEQTRNNLCGKVKRELVQGTLQTFPMHGYGAVQTGVHRFHQPKAPSEGIGEARFVHLWRLKDGAWRITRVISYDHHAVTKK